MSGQIILRPAEPIKNYSQAIKITSYIPCAINDVNLCILQSFTQEPPFHNCHFLEKPPHFFATPKRNLIAIGTCVEGLTA